MKLKDIILFEGTESEYPLPVGDFIIITTTLNHNAWKVNTIDNGVGGNLIWEVRGAVEIPPTEYGGTIEPIFDLSSNIYNENVYILISTLNNFATLRYLYSYNIEGKFNTIDISKAINLTRFEPYYQFTLKSVDVTNNPKITFLYINGNSLITTIDLSNLPLLDRFRANSTKITSFDFTNNPLLSSDVDIRNCLLEDTAMDKVIIDLNNNGDINGSLKITGNLGNLTIASQTAYDGLIANGWTIDVARPV